MGRVIARHVGMDRPAKQALTAIGIGVSVSIVLAAMMSIQGSYPSVMGRSILLSLLQLPGMIAAIVAFGAHNHSPGPGYALMIGVDAVVYSFALFCYFAFRTTSE
jgi:hypothetical protein